MKTRIITGACLTAALVLVFIFSETAAFSAFFAALALVGSFEMLRCIGVHKKWALSLPLYLASAALPMLAFFLEEDIFREVICKGGLILMLYMLAVLVFSHGKVTPEEGGMSFLTITYIAGGFSTVVLLRGVGEGGIGLFLAILIFFGAWMTDTFAYFSGVLCKKIWKTHPLIPDVSPKKTVEGSLGGILFCMLAFMGFGAYVGFAVSGYAVNYLALAITGLLASLVSQIGDLTMSVIKRHFGIKDYGNIFPGHGGVLDRFDSTLAVAILLLVMNSIYPCFQPLLDVL